MQYLKTVVLKDGRECTLRHCTGDDGCEALDFFLKVHEETDYLLSYPDENKMTAEDESSFLEKIAGSEREAEIVAVLGGRIVGMAGFSSMGGFFKVRHRAEFGISVLKEYWNLGIGGALMDACLECAAAAGYKQVELSVMASNTAALALYKKAGFTEFARNPKGFNSRITGYTELVSMRKEL
ncbi:MAG: GNAT family N-acetyltransferase [Clostridia bacterium]|nr:GNAT family N-acetyltransferase [Clostridia bacterium]